MSANPWDLLWGPGSDGNLTTRTYNPDRWGTDQAVSGAAQQIGSALPQPQTTWYDPLNVFNKAAQNGASTTDTANTITSGLTDTGWTTGATPAITNLGVGQMAQGAGQAAAAPGVTPTAWSGMTGGHTGSTYNIAGFNPWTNLAQYNGGIYQTGGDDRGRANTPGGEDDVNRVFRWTNDILKAQGIDQNDPRAAQIFAANVERLKSEYAAAGANWQTSKFANFGAPGSQQQQQGQQGQGQAALPTPGQQQQQGGTGVANPIINPPPAGMGSGLVTGANTAGTSATNQGGTTAGNATGNGNINLGGMVNSKDPSTVIRDFMVQHGVDPNRNSAMGAFIQKVMGSIVPVLFQNMYGSDGQMALDQIGNPMGMLNNIFAGNGNLGASLKSFADNALANVQNSPGMVNNLGDATMKSMLSDLSSLQNFGNNPYLASANQWGLDNQFQQFTDQTNRGLQGGAPQTQSLWDFIKAQGGLNAR